MKSLTIAIISHERPNDLKRMLNSLSNIAQKEELDIIVSDNSVKNEDQIKKLCSKYPYTKLISERGCSQSKNFLNALRNSESKFICFAHDDDYFFLKESEFSLCLKILNSSSARHLYYFKSISFSSKKPYYLYNFNSKIPRPYSIGSFPFNLPVYPSLVYPLDDNLEKVFIYNGEYRPFGKYSDISLVESILESYKYKSSVLPGYYIHIFHEGSDSATRDIRSRLRLLIHSFRKLNIILYPKYISSIILHVTKLIFKNIIRR